MTTGRQTSNHQNRLNASRLTNGSSTSAITPPTATLITTVSTLPASMRARAMPRRRASSICATTGQIEPGRICRAYRRRTPERLAQRQADVETAQDRAPHRQSRQDGPARQNKREDQRRDRQPVQAVTDLLAIMPDNEASQGEREDQEACSTYRSRDPSPVGHGSRLTQTMNSVDGLSIRWASSQPSRRYPTRPASSPSGSAVAATRITPRHACHAVRLDISRGSAM